MGHQRALQQHPRLIANLPRTRPGEDAPIARTFAATAPSCRARDQSAKCTWRNQSGLAGDRGRDDQTAFAAQALLAARCPIAPAERTTRDPSQPGVRLALLPGRAPATRP
ncbi:DUF6207 family protein [Streptomyces sp. NPDC050523]|uniref:DUF6207 family protein n=1 Tax=Streptomyces sp. NPDC050523 TaxID=3365622 RepID=UPI0037AFE5A1